MCPVWFLNSGKKDPGLDTQAGPPLWHSTTCCKVSDGPRSWWTWSISLLEHTWYEGPWMPSANTLKPPWRRQAVFHSHSGVVDVHILMVWMELDCPCEPTGPSLCWVEPRLGEKKVGVPRLLAWGSSFKIRRYVDGPPLVLLPQTLPVLGDPACVGVFLKVENNLCLEKSSFDYSKFSCLGYLPSHGPKLSTF